MHLISLLGLSAILAHSVIASPASNKAILSCEVDLSSKTSHHSQYQVKAPALGDQALADGVYQIFLGDSVLTAFTNTSGSLLNFAPTEEVPVTKFQSKYNSDKGSYTFQLVSTNNFITSNFIQPLSSVILGNAMDFDLIRPWQHASPPHSFVVSPVADPGTERMAIAQSPQLIFPPLVALMPWSYPYIVLTFRGGLQG